MARPTHRMKWTGDTHPPEVEADLGGDLDEKQPVTVLVAQPAPEADVVAVRVLSIEPVFSRRQGLLAQAGAQVRARPFATLAAAFALGFVLLKLFR